MWKQWIFDFLKIIYFGCTGSPLLHGLLVVESVGSSLQWLLLLLSTSFRVTGCSSCDLRAQFLQLPVFDPWVRKIPWKKKWQSSILAWEIPWRKQPGNLHSFWPAEHLVFREEKRNVTCNWKSAVIAEYREHK